jgi:hypothetical protein
MRACIRIARSQRIPHCRTFTVRHRTRKFTAIFIKSFSVMPLARPRFYSYAQQSHRVARQVDRAREAMHGAYLLPRRYAASP